MERSVFLGGSYELHIRVLGGEILKVHVANEGDQAIAALDQGTAVTLFLPPDALRVLRPDEEPEVAAEEQEEETPAEVV